MLSLSAARRQTRRVPLKGPVFQANPGPQSTFVFSNIFEILYGGRAGGGKAHPEDELIETNKGKVPLAEVLPGTLVWDAAHGGYVPVEAITPQGQIPIKRIALEGGQSIRVSLGHLSACWVVPMKDAGCDLVGFARGSQLLTTRQIESALGKGFAVYLPLSRGQEIVQVWRKIEAIEDERPQDAFCLTVAGDAGLYAAGDGIATHNSAGLLIGAYRHLQQYGHPQHNAIIFRRSHAEVKRAPVFQLAMMRFTALKQAGYAANFNGQDMVWDFGQHGKLHYGYLESEHDHLRYQGPEFIYVGFDELTHFRPKHYKYMFTRLRGQEGTPCVIRGATNPGGPHHKYYFLRYQPWLDRSEQYLELVRKGAAQLAEPGQVLYFLPPKDDTEGGDASSEQCVTKGTDGARGRTFLPAGIENTPQYDTKQYNETLAFADPTLRKQLKDGAWIDDDGGGTFFKRQWWRKERRLPQMVLFIRAYDLAWGTSDGAKFTVGTLGGLPVPGLFAENAVIIPDMIAWKAHEATTIEAIKAVAAADVSWMRSHGYGSARYIIRLPDDSGKAGIDVRQRFVSALAGYEVQLIPDKGDKFQRARPVAGQAEYGNIILMENCHPSRDVAIELVRKGLVCETSKEWIEPLVSRLEKVDPNLPAGPQILDHMDSLSSVCSMMWTPAFQPKAGFFRPGVG